MLNAFACRSFTPLPANSPTMQQFARVAELIGLPMFIVDGHTGSILNRSTEDALELLPWNVRKHFTQSASNAAEFFELPGGMLFFSLPLPETPDGPALALGYALTTRSSIPTEVVMAAVEQGWSQRDVEQWYSEQTFCGRDYLEQLVAEVLEQTQASC